MEQLDALFSPRHAALAFFAILFLQSGLDKVFNWRGNLGWLQGHFAKSPLKGQVPLLLGVLTLTEVAAGLCSLAGLLWLLADPAALALGAWGLRLSLLSFLMLFFGQRLAQDYAGASTIAIYFGVGLLALHVYF